MSKRTTLNSTGPPNAKVIEPDTNPDDQAGDIRESMGDIVADADNATPSIAPDIVLD